MWAKNVSSFQLQSMANHFIKILVFFLKKMLDINILIIWKYCYGCVFIYYVMDVVFMCYVIYVL